SPGLATTTGNPVNFGSFTVTDVANRTLTFKLVELPRGVTQVNTFSGTTETIYFHWVDTSVTLTQNIALAINSAFAQYALTNPLPAGDTEPQAVANPVLNPANGQPVNPPQDYLTIDNALATNFANAPAFGANGAGPGGFVTGMAYDLQTGDSVAVSANGGVYLLNPLTAQLTYLPSSAIFTQRGYHFTGLTLGPQNLDWNGDGTPGDLANIMFASYTDANGLSGVTAITPYTLQGPSIFGPTTIAAGAPVAIFDAYTTDAQGNRYATGGYVDHETIESAQGLPLAGVTGIALSPVDFNLWHPTLNRGAVLPAQVFNGNATNASLPDRGHGVNDTPDYSRITGTTANAAANTGLLSNISWTNQDGTVFNQQIPQSQGGASYYFGIDGNGLNYASGQAIAQYGNLADYLQADLLSNPVISNTYNAPGGDEGSLITNSFSLAGYSSSNLPTLYFNYFLNSGVTNNYAAGVSDRTVLFGQTAWKSSARVFASTDGGKTWDEIATNNPDHTLYDSSRDPLTGSLSSRQYDQIQGPHSNVITTNKNDSELPNVATASANVAAETVNGQTIVDPRQQVQQLFDNTGNWRQARIDLGNYAGDPNIQLRFDFSTSGSIGQGSYNSYPFGNYGYTGLIPHNPDDAHLDGVPMPGDQWGYQSPPSWPPVISTQLKDGPAVGNQHEGWYIDDILVGLASRGEMATDAPTSQTSFFTTPQNTSTINVPTQNLTGPYQLDVRTGTPTGSTINPNLDAIILYPNQLNAADRQSASYTLVAPATQFNQSVIITPGPIAPGSPAPIYTITYPNVPDPTGNGTLVISGVAPLSGSDQYLVADFPDLLTDPLTGKPQNNPAWAQLEAQLKQNVSFTQQDKAVQGQVFTSPTIQLTQQQLAALKAAGRGSIHVTLTPFSTVKALNAPPTLNSVTATSGGNLPINTIYYYEVTATDANGESLPSGEESATVTGANQTLNVAWEPLAGATGYRIYRGTAPGQENTLVGVTDGNTLSLSDPGALNAPGSGPGGPIGVQITAVAGGNLAALTTYFYKITALTLTGETSASAEVSAKTTLGQQTLSLTWNPVVGALGYRLYRSTASGQETLIATITGAITQFQDAGTAAPPLLDNTQLATTPSLLGAIATTGGSLQPPPLLGGAYYYVVTAIDAQGETVPDFNTEGVVTSIGNVFNEVVLNWTSVKGATGYKVYRGTAAGLEDTLIALVGPNTLTFRDIGAPTFATPPTSNTTGMPAPIQTPIGATIAGGNLAPNTTYYYVVTAVNGNGETLTSNERSATTTATNLSLPISWKTPDLVAGIISSYRIYRGTAPGQENVLVGIVPFGINQLTDLGGLTLSAPPTSDTSGGLAVVATPTVAPIASNDSTLIAGQLYYYKVTATETTQTANGPFTGENTPSQEASAAAAAGQALLLNW
ncbi:MAG TPA: hypothetical protein VG125_28275, partial [Pirellulales bacterium]|nr:hypothetical protein [Pirellulales bacterium]